jgi:hypothetical protein
LAESLRLGHYVEPHLVEYLFSPDRESAKGLGGMYLHSRCRICRSIRRWHDNHGNAYRRAADFRRQHAERWVKKGRHPDVEAALLEMDVGGVTVDAVAALLLCHIGKECPGYCAYEEDHKLIRHRLDRVADMSVDVKDPGEPFSMENLGVLCISCNPAKSDKTWTRFAYERRAQLVAWQAAIDNDDYRRAAQMSLDLYSAIGSADRVVPIAVEPTHLISLSSDRAGPPDFRCTSVKQKVHCDPPRTSTWRCKEPAGHEGPHKHPGQSSWT